MANLFSGRQINQALSPKQALMAKYTAARVNLLLAVAFTVVNMILLLVNGNTYFLFSVFIPYFITDLGMFLCGKYPAEYYAEDFPGMTFIDQSFLIVMIIIAVIILGLYVLSWFMSRNQRIGWLIFGLVLFGLDTLTMLALVGISLPYILDIAFHAWVIYYLVAGIVAHYKLKNLSPVEEGDVTAEDFVLKVDDEPEENTENTESDESAEPSGDIDEGDK